MDSMLFIVAVFVSVFLAVITTLVTITIRKLKKEVNNLKEENSKLKDEKHSLSCTVQSLLWQRAHLREEIVVLISDSSYFFGRQDMMFANVKHVGLYDEKGLRQMSVKAAWEIAVKMIYNWS